ncbi:MAG: hypothetical protein ACWA40_10390 [Planktomarina sp.]
MSFDETRNGDQFIDQNMRPDAYRQLWCAVIHEQLTLATSALKKDSPYEVAAARRWFGSRDFFMVCDLAGLDGDYIWENVCRVFKARGITERGMAV